MHLFSIPPTPLTLHPTLHMSFRLTSILQKRPLFLPTLQNLRFQELQIFVPPAALHVDVKALDPARFAVNGPEDVVAVRAGRPV